jgi:hypothetical protein
LKTIRSRVPTQSPQDPQLRIQREPGRGLHPVLVPASMSFAPADATWISAAACSDRPWGEPSVRLFGTQIENAARRGRGPSHAREQRMVTDHRGMVQSGHQRGRRCLMGGQCSAGALTGSASSTCTGRCVPSRRTRICVGTDGQPDGRQPHLVARFGRGQSQSSAAACAAWPVPIARRSSANQRCATEMAALYDGRDFG